MSKLTRRAFISAAAVAGGGVVIGIAMRPGNQVKDLAAKLGDESEGLVHTYIKIDSDNLVTAIVPHSEMGQGVHTALGQMLAEELDADWDQVKVEEAPAIGEYATYSAGRRYLLSGIDFPNLVIPTVDGMMMNVADMLNLQITGGSMSVRTTGILAMRIAGAATREMMQTAAADAWGVPVDEVRTGDSHVAHGPSDRREPYAAFAAAVAEMTPSQTPTFKDPADYKIVG
ncbi:MAG: isoquinoline 1-oxidoreductase, partial [Gammaproteobacteria bacterium]|nr:isoquinoline 1-oxidoreductase [Gammaproteobacteria bacterium]